MYFVSEMLLESKNIQKGLKRSPFFKLLLSDNTFYR